jgi:uncharacterized membrane protein YcaP (DUF421 family)
MDLIIRTVVIFTVILVLTRMLGRRELGSLEPFDLILLIVVGDLVQQGVTQDDYSLTGAVLVIATLALLSIGVSYLSFRVPRLRPVLNGEPIVLVEGGRFIDSNMRRERLTEAEVHSAARQNGLATLDGVRFAVLETNGQISFIADE